jgi:outer membrane lipoprotein LolB
MRVARASAVAAMAALTCAAALFGCAGLPSERGGDTAQAVSFPPVRATFQASGRLSLRRATQALTATFRWRHRVTDDEIDLASPLGQTVARLTGSSTGVSLRIADGRESSAPDWATLTARSLEWALPVDGLVYWIQGAPRPGTPFESERSPDGAPSLLRQDGWTIVYQGFTRDGAGDPRPSRLTLSYPDIEVRMVVDAWE